MILPQFYPSVIPLCHFSHSIQPKNCRCHPLLPLLCHCSATILPSFCHPPAGRFAWGRLKDDEDDDEDDEEDDEEDDKDAGAVRQAKNGPREGEVTSAG